MAFPRWMAEMLMLFLLVRNSFAAVDQNKLSNIVYEALQRYRPSYKGQDGAQRYPMFSLAVAIPYNKERRMYDIREVTDPPDAVKKEILKCEVYRGSRVVAATVLRWPNVLDQCPHEPVQWPDLLEKCRWIGNVTWLDVNKTRCDIVRDGRADHAEYRVLQNFNSLSKSRNKKDLLLFYVLASPCDQRCSSTSNRFSILGSIKVLLNWNNYVVVFSDIFKPRNGREIPEKQRIAALERLGKSVVLSNIFRCKGKGRRTCWSCLAGRKVAQFCFSDQPQPGFS